MADRLRIDSTASSPFRMSAAGVDVNSASFNTLIFDANQPPLKFWRTGWYTQNGISDNDFNGGQNIAVGAPGDLFPAPSGQTALFIVMTKVSDPAGNPNGAVRTPFMFSRQGGGGGMCSQQFVGANMYVGLIGSGGSPGPQIYVAYVVFQNTN